MMMNDVVVVVDGPFTVSLAFLFAHAIFGYPTTTSTIPIPNPKERWRMNWSVSPIPGAIFSVPFSSWPFVVPYSSKHSP
jgi:hypothetical protein